MIRILLRTLCLWLAVAGSLTVSSCTPEDTERESSFGYQDFIPLYNRYIANWLVTEQAQFSKDVARLEGELAAITDDTERGLMESQLTAARNGLAKIEFRQGLGDYLRYREISELPADLVWENGMDEEEIGDPRANKGGIFRNFIPAFPPTIRPFGENSNNSFRGSLYDNVEMTLVGLHPDNMALIPALAHQWAVSPDGRTVYFQIDPEATYSDGEPVRAEDFLVNLYLRVSDAILNPYAKQFYRENIAQFAVYDERTLSISLPEANLYAAATAGAATASQPKFYKDYGPDYSERYQWKFPPTTGAYEVKEGGLVKGVSITQERVKDWWARDRKYYRYRFNADQLINTVVATETKAFELFRAGQLDSFLLTQPNFWYEKSEIPPVYDGYIERYTFYNRYPKVPRGLYLNVVKEPLDQKDVRVGIMFAMNWQRVIDTMFRGDYQRLASFNEGFRFSDPNMRARPFSVAKAREAFRAAGYTREGRDGILQKPDGTRLSVSATFPAFALTDQIFSILREEAKNCGLDLRLDSQEATVAYRKVMQKQHQMALASYMISPPLPDFHQFLHSTNAFDEKGNIKVQTNNLFSWARADTDRLCDIVRTAATAEEMTDAVQQLQHIMQDEAIFAPGYVSDFVRVGSWRWMRWPDSEFTRFSPAIVYDPHDSFVYWIDEEMKDETLGARRSGETFPEVRKTFEEFRSFPGAEPTADEVAEPDPNANPDQEIAPPEPIIEEAPAEELPAEAPAASPPTDEPPAEAAPAAREEPS